MQLIIHAGFHKTGTSSLQAFCRLNRAHLAKQGILYPEAGISTLQHPSAPTAEGGHRRFDIILSSPTNKTSRKRLQSIIDEVSSYQDIHTVLISSETFSAPNKRISSAVLNTLQQYFSQIKVLVYLRRQDDWADSFYREVLCWSRRSEVRSFESFNERFLPPWVDYVERLEKWTSVFGHENMIVKSYDDREHKNIIVDFFSIIWSPELPDNVYTFPVNTNPSLPCDLIPLMQSINKLQLNPEQRSSITRRIYGELSNSKYQVKKNPVITSAEKKYFLNKYQAVNQKLCHQYGIDNCEYFCFKVDKPDQPEETSLPEAQVEQIKQLAVNLSKNTSDSDDEHFRQKNKGRVGISCLLNEEPLQVKIFVKYHLALGVSRIRLYFDNPNDPMTEYDYGTDKVEVIRCTPGFWETILGGEPDANNEKLYACHEDGLNYLNQRDDIDWAINVDADELIYVDPKTSLQEYMSKVSLKTDQVRIRPLENIFVSDEDTQLFASRYFKVPRLANYNQLFARREGLIIRGISVIYKCLQVISSLRPLRKLLLRYFRLSGTYFFWSNSDEQLYRKYMPKLSCFMREGFLGHRQGRTFTRHGVVLDQMSSHVPTSSWRKLHTQKFCSKLFILHYDAASYPAWHLKWHRRIYGDTTANKIGGERLRQQDMFLEAIQQGEDAAMGLFNSFFRFPESAIHQFEQEGLVVKLDNPLLEKVKLELEE